MKYPSPPKPFAPRRRSYRDRVPQSGLDDSAASTVEDDWLQADPDHTAAQRELTRRSWWPGFSRELESRYQRDTWPARWRHMLICTLVGQASVWINAVNDPQVFSDLSPLTLWLWLATSVGVFLIEGAGWWFIPPHARRAWHMDLLTALACLPIGLVMIWSTTTSTLVTATVHSANLVLFAMWSCILTRNQLPMALGLSGTLLAAFVLSAHGHTELQQQILWSNTKLLVLASLFSIAANLMLERHDRRTYLLRMIEARQREAIERSGDEFRRLSMVDALSGLHNRRQFEVDFEQMCSQSTFGRRPLGLLLVDVDHFKHYNDHYGHPAGDACLKRVAGLLDHVARQHGGSAARIGGEEFALLLPGLDAPATQSVGETLCRAVRAAGIEHAASPVAPWVTVSIGAVSTGGHCCGHGAARQALVQQADAALYEAKQGGRDQVRLHAPPAEALRPAQAAALQAAPPSIRSAGPVVREMPSRPGVVAQAQELIRAGLKSIVFPRVVENDYQAARAAVRRRRLSTSSLLGVLILDAYVALNQSLIPVPLQGVTSWIVMLNLLLVACAVFVLMPVKPVVRETAFALVMGVIAAACAAVLAGGPRPAVYAAFMAVCLVPLFASIAARLPFWHALLPAAATFGAFLWGLRFDTPTERVMALDVGIMMVTALGFCLLASYLLERTDRMDHLLQRVQQRQKEALSQAAQAMRTLSMQDALTRIRNRRQFDADLARLWQDAGEGRTVALLIADIDHFKRYNDSYGHPAGDACLQKVASALDRVAVEAGGYAARLGGEEFALLLPAHSLLDACRVAKAACAAVRALRIEHAASPTGRVVSLSVGVAVRERAQGAAHELMHAADEALYAAKLAGRDRVGGCAGAGPAPLAGQGGHERHQPAAA